MITSDDKLTWIGDICNAMRTVQLVLLLCVGRSICCQEATTDSDSDLRRNFNTLLRQVMLQQLYMEEGRRADGHSGMKDIRADEFGTRPYHGNSHVGGTIASLHNHANNVRTVGMGEYIAVLNGVEFRTRHNDYELKMKCKRCSNYGATQDIPYPGVPGRVTDKPTLEEQIEEMRQWFKAWKEQDHSRRDYRKFFKPVLCYLEGAWTYSDMDSIEESFESDRHFLDASSWLDLQDKIRFASYAGTKSNLENFAYLPTAIMSIINETVPQLAQWNYKILCHPVQRDVPLRWFRVVDDLKTRMRTQKTLGALEVSRAARFQLNYNDSNETPWIEQGGRWSLLDSLMGEIPGMDNYRGIQNDTVLGLTANSYLSPRDNPQTLNTAFYHRRYMVDKKDAMGLSSRARGYNDENLFMAMTSQSKVAGMDLHHCRNPDRPQTCTTTHQKWTYAIPLEIIYLTPLHSWNPYDIEYKGDADTPEGDMIYGPNNDRDGSEETSRAALDGVNSKAYYITPSAFYDSAEQDRDPADTTKNNMYVRSRDGTVRHVMASGTRIHLPTIPELGTLRQRYPIMPVYGEGGAVWRELEALKDIVMEPYRYARLLRQQEDTPTPESRSMTEGSSESESEDYNEMPRRSLNERSLDLLRETERSLEVLREAKGHFEQTHYRLVPNSPRYGAHSHDVIISAQQMRVLYDGDAVVLVTAEAEGHMHELIVRRSNPDVTTDRVMTVVSCDRGAPSCDGDHSSTLVEVTN